MVNHKPEHYEEDKNIIKRCIEAGINFFDTAEIYAMGESEITLGNFYSYLKEKYLKT